MSRVIGVVSGKGGVGKTTVVANLGATLTNKFNKNVLIFDSNIHTSHLGLHLGMYEDNPVTLREVLIRKAPIMHAIYVHPSTGIRIVPTPLSGDGVDLTKNKCSKLINGVRDSYDMVILDCAPGLGKEVITAIFCIDEALIVTTPDVPAVTDALKTIYMLNKFGKKTLGIVVNRCVNQKYELTSDEISSICNCDVIAKIPEDKRIPESISKGIPTVLLYPNSDASVSLKNLAAHLLGIEYTIEESFVERMKRFLGFRNVLNGFAIKKKTAKRETAAKQFHEVSDIQKLRKELTEEMREEIKNKLVEKVRKRLEERGR